MRYLCAMAAAALLYSAMPATAAPPDTNEILTGSGLVCDTKEQAERFVSLMSENEDVARTLHAVNEEAGDAHACVVATIGFVPGAKVADLTKDGAIVHVIEIRVVAVATARGLQPIEPKTYYSVIASDERSI